MMGNIWKWLEIVGMAKNAWKWIEMDGNVWNGEIWMEMARQAGNDRKLWTTRNYWNSLGIDGNY